MAKSPRPKLDDKTAERVLRLALAAYRLHKRIDRINVMFMLRSEHRASLGAADASNDTQKAAARLAKIVGQYRCKVPVALLDAWTKETKKDGWGVMW